jgi:multiple sugar transport system substrate-binding protein
MLGCVALATGALVGACGGDDDGGGGGGGAAAGKEGNLTEGAKVIDPKLMDNATGTVKYCQGKDTTGAAARWAKAFNSKYASQNLKVEIVEFPASADEQRNQFIQRQQAKSGDCDAFSSDVIWTAEFAAQKWVYDLTPFMESRKDKLLKPPLDAATFENKIWASPETTDAAFIYYQKDQVKTPPKTWQEVYKVAKEQNQIVFQGAPYEGLTCDFLELAFANGGKVLSDDGTKAEIDSPENLAALKLMTDAVQGGSAPKSVTTYMEPESLSAWQTGKYTFMRNWPYAFAASNDKASKVKGKFEVAPLPSFEGAGTAGILGGHGSVISVYSKNPGGALAVTDYLTQPSTQKTFATVNSQAPVLKETYDDPDVAKVQPFIKELRTAVENAKPRPVSQVYPQISQAIYKNVNQAISGQASPEDALKKAQSDIENALSTF